MITTGTIVLYRNARGRLRRGEVAGVRNECSSCGEVMEVIYSIYSAGMLYHVPAASVEREIAPPTHSEARSQV
jgi:RNase P subunit RPR2